MPARCSNGALGQRPAVRRARRPGDGAPPAAGSSDEHDVGLGERRVRPASSASPVWSRSRGVPSASATVTRAAAPGQRGDDVGGRRARLGEHRDLRMPQRGVDRRPRVAAVGGDDERVVPRQPEAREGDRDRRRRGVDVEPLGPDRRAQGADDAEEARVARGEHARRPGRGRELLERRARGRRRARPGGRRRGASAVERRAPAGDDRRAGQQRLGAGRHAAVRSDAGATAIRAVSRTVLTLLAVAVGAAERPVAVAVARVVDVRAARARPPAPSAGPTSTSACVVIRAARIRSPSSASGQRITISSGQLAR